MLSNLYPLLYHKNRIRSTGAEKSWLKKQTKLLRGGHEISEFFSKVFLLQDLHF